MRIETFPRIKIVGEIFGARGCVSSCSCDPCGCGDGYHEGPNYPAWRVSGYHIAVGEIQGLDVSGLTLLSLAQPVREEDNVHWQEVLLADSRATHEQIMALLTQLEGQLESMPAEVGEYTRTSRAVYQVPLVYHHQNNERSLHIQFTPAIRTCIRQRVDGSVLGSWSYNGSMALRKTINDRQ